MLALHTTPFARRATRLAAGLALCALTACGGDGPTETAPPGVSVVASPNLADSAGATPAQPVVVEVRDARGKPLKGATVYFQVTPSSVNGVIVSLAGLANVGSPGFAADALAPTDAAGRAAVMMSFGRVAGNGSVKITVPALGYGTTAAFTVKPGNPVIMVTEPRDTAVYVGGTFTLRPVTRDRSGNVVSAAQPSAQADSAGKVTLAGATVTGADYGRVKLRLTAGEMVDEVSVSVVPRGTLLAAGNEGIYVFGLDGTDFHRVLPVNQPRSPRWLPGGQGFVFNAGQAHAYVSDLNGNSHLLLPNPGPVAAELWTHPSRDGQWVYFGGYNASLDRAEIYRARLDGSELAPVPGIDLAGGVQGHPSASPEGDRMAYFRGTLPVTIRVRDLRTGTNISPDIYGHAPEWSHGEQIAYLSPSGGASFGQIHVMMPDGSADRVLNAAQAYEFGMDWSPDDRWIVAANVALGRIEIVEVATGRRIPLPFTTALVHPSWR